MRHALQLYFRRGMKELADFEGAGGLDKIWRFALGMVQSEDFWLGDSDQSRPSS